MISVFRPRRSILSLLFLFAAINSSAQGRVDAYTASTFMATWTDIATTGIPFTYSNPDTGHGSFPLPFDFTYDGKIIPAGTTVIVPAKGDVSLSGVIGDVHVSALANPADPAMVCPFNGNFIAGKGHGIDTEHYQVDGVAPNRVLTVEFSHMHFGGDGSGSGTGGTGGGNFIPFQAKFYETTGVIEFIYSEHDSSFLGKLIPQAAPQDTIAVGLNGFASPNFVYTIYATKLNKTPATDIRWTPPTSAVKDMIPDNGIQLGLCYPNPSNGILNIPVMLPEEMPVTIELHDQNGKLVRSLFTGHMAAGEHIVTLDAMGLASGTYFYTLETPATRLTHELIWRH